MIHKLGLVILRKLDPRDIESLYHQKNDIAVSTQLGGFSTGYSRQDLTGWLEFHRGRKDECLWAIADAETDVCVGHVGLYQLDHRVRSGEFAIMIGDREYRGKGVGSEVTRFAIDFGFRWLNLNRIQLSVLDHNERAIHVYEKLGFKREGRLREAQFKDGRYIDVVLMSILASEYTL